MEVDQVHKLVGSNKKTLYVVFNDKFQGSHMTDILDSDLFLSESEYERLRQRLEKDTSRNATILLLLMIYGMRSSELLRLRPCDLRPDRKTIIIYGSKRSNKREFPLSDKIWERVARESSKCTSDEERIFKIRYNRLCTIWHNWRPSNKKLHCLRHTAAIRIYQETKDIQVVQRVLGHKSLQNTQVYQQFYYTHEKLKEVFHV